MKLTICASVRVRDGLAFATDSMSQIQGSAGTGVIKTYSNARKLFQIRYLPIGVMTYGIGNIGNRTIQGLMLDFKPTTNDVKGVTHELFDFMKPLYDAQFVSLEQQQKPPLGFFVGGYTHGNPFAEEWEFRLPRDSTIIEVRPQNTFGASWRGIELPFTRLYKGFDPRVTERLQAVGLNQTQIDTALNGFNAAVVIDGMPVQDAINFAVFILRTTIGMSTFEAGPPSCGGPLQVAIILPDSGFEWVMNPKFEVQLI